MNAEKPNFPHDWELIEGIVVAITAPGIIESATWNKYIETLRNPQAKKVISLTRGEVTIDAVKRKQAAEAVTDGKLEVIVVTDSRLTRGMLTAISWLGPNIKAYSWTDLNKALDRAEASPAVRQRVTEIAESFRKLLPD